MEGRTKRGRRKGGKGREGGREGGRRVGEREERDVGREGRQ